VRSDLPVISGFGISFNFRHGEKRKERVTESERVRESELVQERENVLRCCEVLERTREGIRRVVSEGYRRENAKKKGMNEKLKFGVYAGFSLYFATSSIRVMGFHWLKWISVFVLCVCFDKWRLLNVFDTLCWFCVMTGLAFWEGVSLRICPGVMTNVPRESDQEIFCGL